jgi:hypothetical protein
MEVSRMWWDCERLARLHFPHMQGPERGGLLSDEALNIIRVSSSGKPFWVQGSRGRDIIMPANQFMVSVSRHTPGIIRITDAKLPSEMP